MRFERRLDSPRWLSVGVPTASIVAALLAGAVVLIVTGHNPVSIYARLLERGFLSGTALRSALVAATPLVFTGLAAAVAFRMRLWNIGGEGQLYMGAIGASGIGLALAGQPPQLVVPAMIVAGALTGALWSLVPGLLRAYANTNEIITTLMLNYVAGLVLAYLIFDSMSFWRDQSGGATTFPIGARLGPEATWPVLGLALPMVLGLIGLAAIATVWWSRRRMATPGAGQAAPLLIGVTVLAVGTALILGAPSTAVPFGLVVGAAVAAVVWILYRDTRFGFEVRIIGDSPAAAEYSGMNTRTRIVLVMLLSGALAGVGGASQVGDFAHLLDAYGLPQSAYGFTGIVVAALARNNPFGVILMALLLGGLTNAGFSLRGLDFPLGLVGTIQGLILFFAIAGELLVRYRIRLDRPSRARGPAPPADSQPAGVEGGVA